MINFLGQIFCIDEEGHSHIVPITQYDYATNNPQLADIEEGLLPRIDVYSFGDDIDIYAWTVSEEQMFQIIEQVMMKFDPRFCDKYKLNTFNKGKIGPLNEVCFKVVTLNQIRV